MAVVLPGATASGALQKKNTLNFKIIMNNRLERTWKQWLPILQYCIITGMETLTKHQ
jgi:hypothetical protein